jgi:hypothetical protein
MGFEYLLTLGNDLHGELFLPHVVVAFDDDSQQLPSHKVAVWRLFSYSGLLLLTCFLEHFIFLAFKFLVFIVFMKHALVV